MQSKNLLDKLIRIDRSVNVYNNENDDLLEEINIDNIPFEELKKIVPPNADDPLLYDGYELDINQLEKIKQDFDLFSYVLVCGGIYNWGC